MERKIKKILKDSENVLLITDYGVFVEGPTPNLMSLWVMLTKEMRDLKGMTDNVLKESFEMAFLDKEGLTKMLLEKLEGLLKNDN